MNNSEHNNMSIEDSERQKIQRESRLLLTRIGLTASLKGYEYIVYSIQLSLSDRTYLHHIVKRLYVAVGEQFNVSGSCVEHSIRHAIEHIWNVSNYDNLSESLGRMYNCYGDRPTNAEFIALMSELVKLQLHLY